MYVPHTRQRVDSEEIGQAVFGNGVNVVRPFSFFQALEPGRMAVVGHYATNRQNNRRDKIEAVTHTYGLSSQWSSINPCFSRCPASSLSLCPPQFYLTARWSYYVFDPRSTNCCNSCFPFFSSNRIFPPPMKFQIDPSISPFPDRWFELFFCEISLIRWGKFKSRLRISLHFVIRNDNNCNTDRL